MPHKGDYHENDALKTFILQNYSVDKETGNVRRNGRKPRRKKPNVKGEYRRMEVNGVTIPTARVIVLLTTGDWPCGVVGYKNGNPLDLSPDNLIALSQEQNHRRRFAERGGKMPTKSDTSVSGVSGGVRSEKHSFKERGYKAEENEDAKQFILKKYSYIKETGAVIKGEDPDDPYADVHRIMVGKTGRGSKLKFKVVRVKGFRFILARVAFLLVNGDWPKGTIRHKNLDRMDTRWSNLYEFGGE